MEPVKFPEVNKVLTAPEGEEENVLPLHVWNNGLVSFSKWKLSFKERLSVLFFGTIWLGIWAGPSMPPVYLQASQNYNFLGARGRWAWVAPLFGLLITTCIQPSKAKFIDGCGGTFQDGTPWRGLAFKTWHTPKGLGKDLKLAVCIGQQLYRTQTPLTDIGRNPNSKNEGESIESWLEKHEE